LDRIYLLFYKFAKILAESDSMLNKKLLFGLKNTIFFLDKKHRKFARANLDLVFKDSLTDLEKELLIKKTYHNLFFNLLDFISTYGFSQDQFLNKITFKNKQIIDDAISNNKKIIFFTGHYGNWEMLSLALGTIHPSSVVGRDLDSQVMQEKIELLRQQFGVKLISSIGAVKSLIRDLNGGRNILLLTDQNIGSEKGLSYDFLGSKASHITTVANLSRSQDAIIIPVFITTKDNKNYEIEFKDSFKCNNSDDRDLDIYECMLKQTKILEEQILKKPDEWFWLHRRWKAFNPDMYK